MRSLLLASVCLLGACEPSSNSSAAPEDVFIPVSDELDPTTGDTACAGIEPVEGAPHSNEYLRAAETAAVWREYRYATSCLEDDVLRADILRELARRDDIEAMTGLGVLLLYNMDASDDAEAVRHLEQAQSRGSEEARVALNERRQAR